MNGAFQPYRRRDQGPRHRFFAHRITGAVIAALLLTVLAAAAPVARADDLAICIGVNYYPNLRVGANLSGCVNDARMFAKKLQQLGFHDTLVLANEQATKDGILGTISSLRARLHSGDRVVVYFAGHGSLSSTGASVVLPSDALDTSEANDLQVKDLYIAMMGLGGDDIQKTVILDSCHSGGMVHGTVGLNGYHNLRPRFYVRTVDLNKPAANRPGLLSWQAAATNGGDDLSNVVQDVPTGIHGVCYFTAAQKNEVANETTVHGETHGLFTYYLVDALKDAGDLWKNVGADVSDKVASNTNYEQKPQIYPSSVMNRVVFGGSATPTPQPLRLDAVYDLSSPDSGIVALKRYLNGPNRETGPISVGSKSYFEIEIGRSGYLVVIGRDTHNNLAVLFPATPKPEATGVHKGQVVRIPGTPSGYLTSDAAGSDGVKAILFTAPEMAQAMIVPFVDYQTNGYRKLEVQSAARLWSEVDATDAQFSTSEITTQIFPAMGTGY